MHPAEIICLQNQIHYSLDNFEASCPDHLADIVILSLSNHCKKKRDRLQSWRPSAAEKASMHPVSKTSLALPQALLVKMLLYLTVKASSCLGPRVKMLLCG
jgi:hypothetical protein